MVTIVNGLLLRDGQVLMAKRSSARRIYPGTWSFPGGHVEAEETLIAALAREMTEEVGVTPDEVSEIAVLHDGQGAGAVTFHLFAIQSWHGDPENLGDEHSELRWITPNAARDLPDLALPAYREILAGLAG